ncbi:MAG: hypothetical protein IPK60_00200 [Sandaracinaceae bacterium]|jgi:hypothetical protein|nr:hypothetical protein [Sandaracinaceae bacterium]
MNLRNALACLASLTMIAACKGDEAPAGPVIDVTRSECENLNPEECLLPWPSSRFLVDDATTPTGRRVNLTLEAMPANDDDVHVDPAEYNRGDGFSPMTSFMTLYPGVVDASTLPTWRNIDASMEDDSPTIIYDITAGARVAHFSEFDVSPDNLAAHRPMYIRPAARLAPEHHYVIATRNLHHMDGTPVDPTNYFRALRDNTATDVAELEARRAKFETDVFAPLTAAGIERSTLIEAWDMWTGSDESAIGDLVSMRDDAMTRVGTAGLGCTITTVEEPTMEENGEIFRKIEGTFTVPLYMETDQPGARLRRDSNGRPLAQGTAEAPFEMIIPRSVHESVTAGGAPVRLMTYGHGLFGGRDEIDGGYVRNFANDYPTVVVATDWWGMAQDDVPNATTALTEMTGWVTITDRLTQGVVNTLILTRTMAGSCLDNEAFQTADGHPYYDPSLLVYHGNSQGGIMGGTVAALSLDISHFGLGVAGIDYSVLIPRSVDYIAYETVFRTWYRDKFARQMIMVMLPQLWEHAEPSAFVGHVLSDVIPGSPTGKRVLLQVGLNDAQVSTIGADREARTMGLPMFSPSVIDVQGVTTFADSSDSGYVIYDVGAEMIPDGCTYADGDTTAHEGVRRDPRAQMQLDAFLRPDGRVQNFCGTMCSPLTATP